MILKNKLPHSYIEKILENRSKNVIYYDHIELINHDLDINSIIISLFNVLENNHEPYLIIDNGNKLNMENQNIMSYNPDLFQDLDVFKSIFQTLVLRDYKTFVFTALDQHIIDSLELNGVDFRIIGFSQDSLITSSIWKVQNLFDILKEDEVVKELSSQKIEDIKWANDFAKGAKSNDIKIPTLEVEIPKIIKNTEKELKPMNNLQPEPSPIVKNMKSISLSLSEENLNYIYEVGMAEYLSKLKFKSFDKDFYEIETKINTKMSSLLKTIEDEDGYRILLLKLDLKSFLISLVINDHLKKAMHYRDGSFFPNIMFEDEFHFKVGLNELDS